MTTSPDSELLTTPLHDLHVELGGRMVPFAGYDMPVQFKGVVAEHIHTRSAAGLFDVAHMGVIELVGDDDYVGSQLERILPSAISTLKPGRQRYSFLTNIQGGVIDDLMVSRTDAGYTMVVNASRKHIDLAHVEANLEDVQVISRPELAILALQGPGARAALAEVVSDPETADALTSMPFMSVSSIAVAGVECRLSRSGYTGEDGFEFIVAATDADVVARALLAHDLVQPIGLGARDTLRLEAGLCLYGNDLEEDITPIEAGLVWAIQKRRREQGGFIGEEVILSQIAEGVHRVRVGIRALGRRPVRDHSSLHLPDGLSRIGEVTSGGFGPSLERPVAMGYVPPIHSTVGTELIADVRGKEVPGVVSELPFVPHNYFRG